MPCDTDSLDPDSASGRHRLRQMREHAFAANMLSPVPFANLDETLHHHHFDEALLSRGVVTRLLDQDGSAVATRAYNESGEPGPMVLGDLTPPQVAAPGTVPSTWRAEARPSGRNSPKK